MVPARELGLRRVWVDREDSGHDPSIVTARVHGHGSLARLAAELYAAHDAPPPPTRLAEDRSPATSRATRPASGAPRGRPTVLPGGNTRSVLHFDPFPLAFDARRGRPPVLARRRPLHGLPRRVHGGPVRALEPGDPRRRARGARRGHQLRRHQRPRAPAGRAAVRALPGAGARALHELRHRGEPDGAGARAPSHRPARDPGVQGRLPRRRARVRQRASRARSRSRTRSCSATTTTSRRRGR